MAYQNDKLMRHFMITMFCYTSRHTEYLGITPDLNFDPYFIVTNS